MLAIFTGKEHSLVQFVYNTEVLQLEELFKFVLQQQMIEVYSEQIKCVAFTLIIKSHTKVKSAKLNKVIFTKRRCRLIKLQLIIAMGG